ncbi:Serine/threonine protein kinase, partial [Phytophthora palmivora]
MASTRRMRKRTRVAEHEAPAVASKTQKTEPRDSTTQMIQSVAANWETNEAERVKTGARVLGSDDRYMRRKKREYIQEVLAAHEVHAEGQDAWTQDKETNHVVEQDGQEQVGQELREKKESAEAQKPRTVLETSSPQKQMQETLSEEKEAGEMSPLSPNHASVHSPVKTIGTKRNVAIDPTPEKSAPPVVIASKPKKNVARGIAQSSSSASTRKRMISFSPERAPRPENRALALKKLEKNIKTNEKLQQRLKAPTPVKAPPPTSTDDVHKSASKKTNDIHQPVTSPKAGLPNTSTDDVHKSASKKTNDIHQPVTSPKAGQTEELVYDPTQEDPDKEKDVSSAEVVQADPEFKSSVVIDENIVVAAKDEDARSGEEDNPAMHDEMTLSQESTSIAHSQVDKLAPLSQESCDSILPHREAEASAAHMDSSSSAFTSTSVIGDVGLFNCETDAEYTGGVYGEGTDGKVTAAVINGQKVALKRAKPHEGFPEHEAKHRAALELHYLRRVRHMKGFLQCLGLCDAIEHTCIALEVMDCKLSDYLRRYGVNSGGSKHRRYTLSFADTKAMLKQICLPMITLHDDINVAHGDLACRNILMRTPPEGYEQSWEPDIKLSDFGRIKLPTDEPKILDSSFSFHKNCDVGAFGREILYRLLVGEIVPKEYVETRSLHKLLQDVIVTQVPEAAKARLGPYYNLFMRCTAWGVRPTFREIYEHLDDLEYFETTENGLFPLKPTEATFMSPVTE